MMTGDRNGYKTALPDVSAGVDNPSETVRFGKPQFITYHPSLIAFESLV
ncbi:MAG TPA: hypothetical protein VM943_05485 [Pyrinomonadaceae bacterium]|nr:hypothetical protein [Pyrinomonadaceae bacterium]